MTQDVRWKQRFSNFLRAFQTLTEAIELSKARALTPLEHLDRVMEMVSKPAQN
jgi:hypothetical protein